MKDGPHEILGLSPAASAEEIRAAYLKSIKEHPPDRDPAAFERIRDAYDTLRDPYRLTELMLLADSVEEPLVAWLERQTPERNFVGPEPWLEAMRRSKSR
jgi:DnaJ-domain-containing protein 1